MAVACALIAPSADVALRAAERTDVVAVAVAPDGSFLKAESPEQEKPKKRRRGMRPAGEDAPAVEGVAAADAVKPKRRRGMRSDPGAAVAATEADRIVPDRTVRRDVVAVVPPEGRLEGVVLAKDGVTRLPDTDLILDHRHFGTQHRVTADGDGRFEIALPIGQYDLTIRERHEVYESPSTYTVPLRDALAVDFILLRHFETGREGKAAAAVPGRDRAAGGVASGPRAAASDPERWLPDPARPPVVVGSVVDLVPAPGEHARAERRSWRETLGFLGSVLLIAILAL